jgi:hypothetical protein
MALDMKQRKHLAQIDDARRQQKIVTARSIIYEKRYAVDAEAVEKILKEESLVPTSVSVKNMWLHLLTSTPRMHSQPA